MVDFRKQKLCDFVAWARQHITGDEKGEAQIFLDRLFQAFGQGGIREAGATLEMRVKQADNKGTAFADLVWKPVVLIEMKKRGEDLTRHYRQAFDYWTRLVPGRPRYVVLCNFDQFQVYDFQTQMDVPVDSLTLEELPDRYGPLNFLFPTLERPVFGNDHQAVTRDAADKLALCFNKLIARNVDRQAAQKFILQMLVALFAEDIGLLDKYLVTNVLEDCKNTAQSYDLLNWLFEAMNSNPPRSGGRFKGVPYFNGGLFAASAPLELYDDELNQLRAAAKSDWSKVRPEIFGTLFEHSLEKEARHAFGQHFTNPVDIMKIVAPTIVEPWRERIESAKTIRDLRNLHQRMLSYTVLDPACGSGNFLYVAYRELKRLEARIIERIADLSAKGAREQLAFGFVTARQFYGMDISPFACELAKVTMMIARKLAIDELHATEQPLPMDNLDANFIVGDALIDAEGKPVAWPKADVIIGNPPFLGSRYVAKAHGYPYVRLLHAAYPDVPQMADYCVHWLRKAHDHLPACTPADPLAGRAGLVGTQNIRNNQSRVGGLDHIARTGTIVEAVDNQPWSGEANVHVSIVDWVKTQDAGLLPGKRRLWSTTPPPLGGRKVRKRGSGPASKEYELAYQDLPSLSSALSADLDTSAALVLACNATPKTCYVGQYPFNEGFYIERNRALAILAQDSRTAEVLFPYMIGRDLVTDGKPARWIIDFDRRTMLDASGFGELFDQVKERVMPVVLAKAAAESKATGKDSTRWTRLASRWWQFRDYQPGTMRAIAAVPRYIVCSRVTKMPVFAFVSNRVHPDNTLMVFPFADDYSFGVLQSDAHWRWFITKCSKLGPTSRYTAESVFDTFPWPQKPTARRVEAVAEAGREIRRIRAGALPNMKGGLRALYRLLELPGDNPLKDAHAALDQAVLAAYGFDADRDLLAQLLELNLQVAGRIEQGQGVTAPGVPPTYPTPAALITPDCIEPGPM
jgi:type I restriction-modification system DNA methylase subunit